LLGAYNASKYALEGVADALRLELHSWRIPVIVIQPAQTDTDMWQKADETVEQTAAALSPEQRELYEGHIEGMRRSVPHAQKLAVPADNVADTILRALTSRRPRARYIVGMAPRAQIAVARVLPTPVLDTALRRAAGVPGPK
jgi:NAD(P)-dependent dehydrogenase (short-subunit alcohol dehydrogenase family)